jgi:hypothetical protein
VQYIAANPAEERADKAERERDEAKRALAMAEEMLGDMHEEDRHGE